VTWLMKLKAILLSCAISLLIHVIYFAGAYGVEYAKKGKYKPGAANTYENIAALQHETAAGMTVSPLIVLFTFIGVAFIGGLLIALWRQFAKKKNA